MSSGENDASLLPIGVFDSGLGGLTVLKVLRERFPHEDFIYLGDTARIPYGSKSPRTIQRYLEQNLAFLTRMKVKAAVIACNSASTQVPNITATVPLYNVISPGALRASVTTQNQVVGVIATRATVTSKCYVTEIQKLNPKIQVYQQACPLLVPLVEEGWDDDPITNLVVYRYLSPLLAVNIDTLILGCTHYPILRGAFNKVLGNRVQMVDSAEAIADQIERDFQLHKLLAKHDGRPSELRIYTTDISDTFEALAKRIMAPMTAKSLELAEI
jgi:glutamate racemase